jgi:hypothetical protein
VAKLVVHLPREPKVGGLKHGKNRLFCVQKMIWEQFFGASIVSSK